MTKVDKRVRSAFRKAKKIDPMVNHIYEIKIVNDSLPTLGFDKKENNIKVIIVHKLRPIFLWEKVYTTNFSFACF